MQDIFLNKNYLSIFNNKEWFLSLFCEILLMKPDKLKIDDKDKKIHFGLNAHTFMEGDVHIIYFPSLEISGYGDTADEAMELAKISLIEFGESLFDLSEKNRIKELTKLGWKRDVFFKKRLQNLSNTTFEDTRKQFNLPEDTKIEKIPVTV